LGAFRGLERVLGGSIVYQGYRKDFGGRKEIQEITKEVKRQLYKGRYCTRTDAEDECGCDNVSYVQY